mgnify:CR=1 FL=1
MSALLILIAALINIVAPHLVVKLEAANKNQKFVLNFGLQFVVAITKLTQVNVMLMGQA